MQRAAIEEIRTALDATRNAAGTLEWDSCDLDDLQDVLLPIEAELEREAPNLETLSTYLNSLARSLRSAPGARSAVLQLDAAMRNAGVPTHWEH